MLDEHKHCAGVRVEMLVKKLMRKHKAYALAGFHTWRPSRIDVMRSYSLPSSNGMSMVRNGPSFVWRPQMRSATSSMPFGS